MRFQGIVGQEQACRLLKREFRRRSVSHAYLFLGPNQVGKTTAAIAFAQLMNCESPDLDKLEPCDRCDACVRIRENRHLDVQLIRPRVYAERRSGSDSEEGKRSKDLPPLAPEYMDDSIISIEAIRDFLSVASHKPLAGRQRVFIFCEAEKMNVQAQNCLLKTLEEPIPNETLILITQHAGELLPTIVSRCQGVRFGLVAEDSIRDLARRCVKSQTDAPQLADEKVDLLASVAGGRPGWALRAIQHPERIALHQQVFDFIAALHSGSDAEALGMAERSIEFAEQLWRADKEQGAENDSALKDANARSRILRSSQAEFLELLAGWFRDLLVAQFDGVEPAIVNTHAMSWLKESAASYSRTDLIRYIEMIHQTRRYILANANGQLALEVLFLNLMARRKTR